MQIFGWFWLGFLQCITEMFEMFSGEETWRAFGSIAAMFVIIGVVVGVICGALFLAFPGLTSVR